MISIAMTSYNGEKYIVKQLESIRVQTIIPDEVIIIDSHDNIITTKLNPFSSNSNLIRKRLSNNICTKISIEEVLTYNISPGCTSAFRSEIREDFIKLKKESMQLTHDWKINIIAALRDGLYFLNTTTTYYRIHDNNTLGLHRSMNIKERISVIEKLGCERKLISNIICGFQGMEKVHSKVDINKSKLYAEYIYCLVELRKDALRKLNLLQALKLLMNYKAIKSRYVESIIVDILIIIKEKLK